MSRTSFPRPEHVALLKQKIEERIRKRRAAAEVAERGLNQLKCQYKFGLRRSGEDDWIELAIHFQFADRLQNAGGDAELNRLIDSFLTRHFQ